MTSARDFALVRLDSRNLPEWRPHCIARNLTERVEPPADPRDRALAEQLETGVIKNLLQLQHLIEMYADRPLPKIHPALQKILAVAIYQLRFLDRVPVSAAVDEAVDQAKRFGMRHAAGFTNAVLRKATTERKTPLPDLPDATQTASVHWSHPQELFARFSKTFGDQQALAICKHDNTEPPTIVRLCAGKTLNDLTVAGAQCLPHNQPGFAIVQSPARPLLAEISRNGIAQVQDPTAASVIPSAELSAGKTVLDRCCGMGTKTLQAWEYAGPTAAIVAIDPAPSRCKALLEMLAARSVTNVRVVQSEEFPGSMTDIPQVYDLCLLDVPCSNSGVLARRPEARYSQSARAMSQLQSLQQNILTDTAQRTKHGGKLIYSTCSLWPEENQEIVQWFLALYTDYHLVREQTTLPSCSDNLADYHDGGYFAILERAYERPAGATNQGTKQDVA